ncbi:hypothetical protein GWK47_026980 [Chionoecetes opilio]|uniref:Uncharacterized protein n=1 Tax=Chionoecetes opilio TaxID=41210 RepID=A0A8J8WKZ8_CHIOP|nr:hypothetical protein GWK47_026980 [Chionoecetes opilio]
MGVHRTEDAGGGLGILEEEEEDEDLSVEGFFHHYSQRQHSGASSTDSDVLNNNQVDGGKGKEGVAGKSGGKSVVIAEPLVAPCHCLYMAASALKTVFPGVRRRLAASRPREAMTY